MGRSKETFGKKEVRNKRMKKRKDKEKRKIEKKEQGKQSLDDMIAYVDDNGMITDTPPDTTNKEEIDASSIEIGIPKKEFREEATPRTGTVTKFDDSKGYGFINDSTTKESIFFHINDCECEIKNGNLVEFDTERGQKGIKAKDVKVKK
jgi:cold shock CspA family protein